MNLEERKLMQKAQKAGQFTDFAFLCKGTKIPVHKVIICAQSKVFNAACTSGFKEAISGVYDLSEYPLELVEMMVDYFYLGYYEDPRADVSKVSLSTHLSMLALADKYAIRGLEPHSKLWFIHRLNQKNTELKEFLDSLPVLDKMPISVSRDVVEEAVYYTRETLLTCTYFLKEVMLSIMSTPVASRCSDCSKSGPPFSITLELAGGPSEEEN
ncbi:hypothetical protein FPANT_1429 [Fusarium pseudoanthophilum]|uniref:BTB domain-containing protein n=1 Tax=Fusarium pseudoanthophilum TaxID=48495 RepID=A0A8H5V0W9_9HYPO|nr:hypothetical protein FPANT_1429 [Fusarium pseudoanthophilum]